MVHLVCSRYCLSFSSVCRNSLDELFPLFFSNLEDSIPSVRQGGAVAIANVVKAYGGYITYLYSTFIHIVI